MINKKSMYEPIIKNKNKLSIESRIEWQSIQRKINYIDANIRKCSESAVYRNNVKIPGKSYKKMSEINLFCMSLLLLLGIQFGYTHGLIVADNNNSNNNGEYIR